MASTVEAVLAQRLVRTVCSHCAELRPATDEERRALPGLADTVRVGDGCDTCRGTGFLGRTGTYELLRIDDAIRDEVHRRSGSAALKRLATDAGMRTLREDGLRLVREGRTTPAEVLRVAV